MRIKAPDRVAVQHRDPEPRIVYLSMIGHHGTTEEVPSPIWRIWTT